jgi:non-homologous end joining protein Ku
MTPPATVRRPVRRTPGPVRSGDLCTAAGGPYDPVYFNSPYYLYPDGQMAVEAIRVIGAAMGEAGVAGIGRLTMSRRERMVVVEPRGAGMVLVTLRAVDEVRAPHFGRSDLAIDAEMLAIARTIIERRPANSTQACSETGTRRRSES